MAVGHGLMAGKKGLILGVANNRSIAWGIAKACADQGAELSLTYQGDAFRKRVEPLAQELGAHIAGHCDVTDHRQPRRRLRRRSPSTGASSISSSMPSPSPTRTS